jgi:hypothetical protein
LRALPDPPSNEDILGQLGKLLNSTALHGSETLCKLLNFLVRRVLEHPGQTIKEYQIATELLARSGDFDPRLDPTVRVQIGRLRSKLVEYYATEGAEHEPVIEIPKGSYMPVFRRRTATAVVADPFPAPAPKPRGRLTLWLLLAGGLAAAAIATALLARPEGAAFVFWKPLMNGPEPPLVVFSNALFVGDPSQPVGLHYFDPERHAPTALNEMYTGVGEVFAVHALDRLFHRFGRTFVLKRGRLMNWDDARNRNIVFVGSPSENLHVAELPLDQEFAFRRVWTPPFAGGLFVANVHPRPGEQDAYRYTTGASAVVDYGVITLAPGPTEGQSVLLLAGISTQATHGAVEFVCNEDKLAGLLRRLDSPTPVPFSALIRVRVQGGVPVNSELVLLRRTAAAARPAAR